MRFLRLCRWAPSLILCVAISTAATQAHAFTDSNFFTKDPKEGGSDGRWFTGAPADGFGCSVCHSGKPAERLVVEGLPMQGYVPGDTYKIRIAWPDVAARTRHLYATQPASMLPRASVVAEFIAETGADSGVVVQGKLADALPQELCHTTSTRKRFGLAVYRKTVDIGTKIVTECDGQNFTRCIVATRACGNEEVRFTWRAPEENQGTIWFAAGFVATDLLNAHPDLDAVTEVNIPIAPAGAAGVETELGQACAIGAGTGAHRASGVAWLLLVGLGLWVRARARRGRGRP